MYGVKLGLAHAFCGKLPALAAAPGMHDQRQCNDTIGNEHPEVFPDGCVTKQVLPRIWRHNKQQVKEDAPYQGLAVGSTADGRPAGS